MSSSPSIMPSPRPSSAQMSGRSSSRISRASTASTCSMSTTLTKETSPSNLQARANARKSQLPAPRSHHTPERRRSLPGKSNSFSKRPTSIPSVSTPQATNNDRPRTFGSEPSKLDKPIDRVASTLRRLSGGSPVMMKTPTRVPTPSSTKAAPKESISEKEQEKGNENDSLVDLMESFSSIQDPPDPPTCPEKKSCLGDPLSMLHTAMSDNAKAYEYLFDKDCDKQQQSNAHSSNEQQDGATASVEKAANPLVSMMQIMQQQHEQEKQKLQKSLQSAKAKNKHYKAELRENLSERLQFLEDRVMQAQATTSCDSSRAATASQVSDVLTPQIVGNAVSVPQRNDDDSMMFESVYQRGSDTAVLEERLCQTQQELANEKKQWSKQLDVLEQKYTADLQAWQKEVMQLKDDSRRLLSERNQLKSQLWASSSTEEVRKQLDRALQERDEAVTLVEELQSEVTETRKDLKEVKRTHKQQLKSLGEPIDQVEAVYRESVEKRKELAERMRQMEMQHSNDKATWKLQLECALANARRASTELEQSQQELERIGETVKEANAEMAKHNNGHQQDLDQARTTHQQEIQALCDSHKEELAAQREQHLAELETVENRTNELALQFEASAKEQEAFQAQEFEKTTAELMEKHGSAQAEHDQTITELQQELAEAKFMLDEVSGRLDESQEEVDVLTTQLEKHQKENESILYLKAELDTARRQIKEKNDLLEKSQRQISDLEDDLALSKALETKEFDSADELNSLKSEVNSLRLQISTSLEREEEQASLQKDEMDIAKKRQEELIASCASLENEVSTWRNQCRQLEQELSETKQLAQHVCSSPTEKVRKEISQWKETASKLERSVNDLMESEAQTAEKYQAQLEDLQRKNRNEREECEKLTEEKAGLHHQIHDLGSKVEEAERTIQKTAAVLEEMKESHTKEVQELNTSLEELKMLHESSNIQLESEVKRLEVENVDLRANIQTAESDVAATRTEASSAVHELGNEIAALRKAVESFPESVQDALNQSGLIRSVEDIHSTIYDALAEVTLETENLIECRHGLATLLERSNAVLDAEPQRELQEKMVSLGELLEKALEARQGEQTTQLQSPTQLTKCMAELLFAKKTIEDQAEQLEFEKHARNKAEHEIRLLNDQADAYGEEVMRLHALNSNLEDTLNEAERRMETALGSREMAEEVLLGGEKILQDDENQSKLPEKPGEGELPSEDFSSPMLDEALALAHNLTALMQSNQDAEKETSVMEMLETMSNMIDDSAHPSDPEQGIPVEVQIVKKKTSAGSVQAEEGPPLPVLSPTASSRKASTTGPSAAPTLVATSRGELTVVVEQLYSRCQMLERERTDLMEVTLDILQSAREASSAELEAALATARRKSAEELLRVREDNQKGLWRLYHKLCGRCQHGLMADGCQNASCTGASQSSRARVPDSLEATASGVTTAGGTSSLEPN
mmetsp:Transcript_5048/g.10439  ORF Transcript_5048/g.10439 Transcript_5048/m.10439 type:complete len:1448 (+) Transcript_5048:131-4474(+)